MLYPSSVKTDVSLSTILTLASSVRTSAPSALIIRSMTVSSTSLMSSSSSSKNISVEFVLASIITEEFAPKKSTPGSAVSPTSSYLTSIGSGVASLNATLKVNLGVDSSTCISLTRNVGKSSIGSPVGPEVPVPSSLPHAIININVTIRYTYFIMTLPFLIQIKDYLL